MSQCLSRLPSLFYPLVLYHPNLPTRPWFCLFTKWDSWAKSSGKPREVSERTENHHAWLFFEKFLRSFDCVRGMSMTSFSFKEIAQYLWPKDCKFENIRSKPTESSGRCLDPSNTFPFASRSPCYVLINNGKRELYQKAETRSQATSKKSSCCLHQNERCRQNHFWY